MSRTSGLRGLRCHGHGYSAGALPGWGGGDALARGFAGGGRLLVWPGWPLGCGGVFAGALGLQCCGVEDAVAAKGTNGECLRIVLEGIWRRLSAFVDHVEHAARRRFGRMAFKLIHNEGDVRSFCSMEPGFTKPSTRRLLL